MDSFGKSFPPPLLFLQPKDQDEPAEDPHGGGPLPDACLLAAAWL